MGLKQYRKKWRENNKDKVEGYNRKWKEYIRNWNKNNKDKVRESSKNWYKNNKDKVKQYNIKWRENNKEVYKSYIENNKDKVKQYNIKWRENNREYIREYRKEYKKNRRETDKEFNIKERLQKSFNQAFQKHIKGVIKQESKQYNIIWNEIIKTLEPFPENIKDYHIDHIRPLASFTFVKEDGKLDLIEIQKAWCPENLQWLTVKENMSKGAMWNGKRIRKSNKSKLSTNHDTNKQTLNEENTDTDALLQKSDTYLNHKNLEDNRMGDTK